MLIDFQPIRLHLAGGARFGHKSVLSGSGTRKRAAFLDLQDPRYKYILNEFSRHTNALTLNVTATQQAFSSQAVGRTTSLSYPVGDHHSIDFTLF